MIDNVYKISDPEVANSLEIVCDEFGQFVMTDTAMLHRKTKDMESITRHSSGNEFYNELYGAVADLWVQWNIRHQ